MPLTQILMVLGGDPPSEEILKWRIEESDLTIAVDSGWLAFRHDGIFPNILIGDMDSWGGVKTEVPQGVEIIVGDDQNTTDFQKALCFVNSLEKYNKLIILGCLGNRTDHLLGNLMHICNISQMIEVIIDSEKEWICRVTAKTPLVLKGQEGATLSLLPGSPCRGVSSSGLKWEIIEQDFSFDENMSQSNLCSSNEVEISVLSGNLLVFLQK
ncbi:MAG: thiamine diphosphokinase [Opitutae bacterium]|jgi:thiamine pyrophosphokinase|nr:thiamine diphosphokinase [Opitutae bacterium]